MKKNFKLVLALVLAAMMLLGSVSAIADENSQHVITITNGEQYVSHTYKAYQIFKGKLDTNGKLSDIVWGDGVDGANLLAALKSSTNNPDYYTYFANCDSPSKVAEALGKNPFQNTAGTTVAGAIDTIASIINGYLTTDTNKIHSFTENPTGTYKTTVTGDGYYFIKDVTTSLTTAAGAARPGSDTLSKYLLAVVQDLSIAAKDTHLTPDKEILITEGQASPADYERVKENTAAIGDVVTFEVSIPVPDTRKYQKGFIFDMQDILPDGMTFMDVSSVKVGTSNVTYSLKVAQKTNGTYGEFGPYTKPNSAADAVEVAGGQKIKLDFTNFKAEAEANNAAWIGQTMVVTYTAVVNKFADFTPTGNKNEVWFDYSNDPNSDYTGTNPSGPVGQTPHDETKTFLINLEIIKTGDNGTTSALEGAEFTITSTDYNVTLVTGEKFEEDASANPAYYKLADGSYTTTAPAADHSQDSLYDDTTKKYKKVPFTDSVTTPGSTNAVTVITGSDGKINLKGLRPGTYTVEETKAPSGYNRDTTQYTIKIDWNYNTTDKTGTFSRDDNASTTGFSWNGTDAKMSVTIDNKSGATLPSTGGVGTTIFYVGGSILVLAAAILLITKRRMSNND